MLIYQDMSGSQEIGAADQEASGYELILRPFACTCDHSDAVIRVFGELSEVDLFEEIIESTLVLVDTLILTIIFLGWRILLF